MLGREFETMGPWSKVIWMIGIDDDDDDDVRRRCNALRTVKT